MVGGGVKDKIDENFTTSELAKRIVNDMILSA